MLNRRNVIGGVGASLISSRSSARLIHGSGQLPIAQLQTNFIAMKWGILLSMGMPTFLDAEVVTPQPVNTWAPGSTFNLDQWIAAVVGAKAKYAVLVAKHHDGFCLWNTATTTYNVTQTSWYAANGSPDIVALFCTKARAAGLVPIIYCSVRDASADGGNPPANPSAFQTFLQAQFTELAHNYGSIAAIWLDGAEWWYGNVPPFSTTFPSSVRNAFIRGLQTNIIAIDNSHTGADSDIIEFEGAIPGSGNVVPSEAVATIMSNGNYFWKSTGNPLRTSSDILTTIATVNGRACNYLLSVSPDNTGVIPPAMVSLLTTVGASL